MNRYDKLVRNIGIVVFILMLGTSVVLGQSAKNGDEPDPPRGPSIFEDVNLERSTAADTGSLTPGNIFTMTIPEKDGKVFKNFTAMLSWSDESSPPGRPRVRRYENQPDTFSIVIQAPDGNSSDAQGANPQGQSGVLEVKISMDDEHLAHLYDQGIAGNGNWTVEVTLKSAGMWVPELGPGFIGLTDAGNDFSLSVDYEYYDLTPEEGEE